MTRLRLGGILIVVLVGLTFGATKIVHAGAKLTYPVAFSGNSATGAMGSVRDDASTDWIGCWSTVTARVPADPITGGTPVVWCNAHNNSGTLSCTSIDAGIVRLVQTIGTDSYLHFVVYQSSNQNDPANGTCTSLEVQNYSAFMPKTP